MISDVPETIETADTVETAEAVETVEQETPDVEVCSVCQLPPPDESTAYRTREIVNQMDPKMYHYYFCVCPECGCAHLEFARKLPWLF